MNGKVGQRIKFIRQKLGLTMEEFGELFEPKASKGVVSNWENNYNLPNNDRLKKIAELGKVSMGYLLNGEKADQMENLREQLLSLQKKKMEHNVYSAQIAVELGRSDLTDESRKQGEKIFNDTNIAIQKLDEAIKETQNYIKALEEATQAKNMIESFAGEANTIVDLENIFSIAQEITVNGKTLTDEEKQKALQILKLTLGN